ncbi:MAG: LytTR family transcriptional regulator [Chitinophagaceae bacterium]|nr:MAG: LytTR family transcriptional regulator [Chitinophagaceae bacterium]
MLHQPTIHNGFSENAQLVNPVHTDTISELTKSDEFIDAFQRQYLHELADLMVKLGQPAGKKSFLVFKNNKYINITTEKIAYFYLKYDNTILVTFDKQEYGVNHSLEEIQHLLSSGQFFRVNRQYLVSFSAIKEVEHYFARKLLVNLTIPTQEKLLISKSKSAIFLQWLDNR